MALELEADFILMDERKGRTFAEKHGLTVTGLVGILIKAKELRHLIELKPILDQLLEQNFRLSKELYERVLTLV